MPPKDLSFSPEFQELCPNEYLKRFIEDMRRFDRAFCYHMTRGTDFTLTLQIHGNGGKVIHYRFEDDGFDRPPGVKAPPRFQKPRK